MSRMISNDQRSPSASSEMLSGHPDRCFDLGCRFTARTLANVTCIMQVIFHPARLHAKRRLSVFLGRQCGETKKTPVLMCARTGVSCQLNYRLLLGAEVIDDSDRKALGILRRAV